MAIRMHHPAEEAPLLDVVLRIADGERDADPEKPELRWWPIPSLCADSVAFSPQCDTDEETKILLWDEASRKTSHDRIHFSDTELRDAQGAVLGVDADIDEVRFLWRSFTLACNDAVEYVAVQDEIYWAEFVIDREQKLSLIHI